MYKVLLGILIIFSSCSHPDHRQSKQLRDTLEKLKLVTDFKPLSQADAYAFINDYYLPRLDNQPTKRKLFIYPLKGSDFKKQFIYAQKILEAKYSQDSLKVIVPDVILAPRELFNKKFMWDRSKLKNTIVITDGTYYQIKKGDWNFKTTKAWHKEFGYGYMCISYPLYNAHTNKLSVTERMENMSTCGTGRENIYWFTKTATGWKEL